MKRRTNTKTDFLRFVQTYKIRRLSVSNMTQMPKRSKKDEFAEKV